MANLPEPDWITLSESARRAAQAFGAELSAVEPALVAAFHDGKIRTRGRCRSYFNDDWLHDLARSTWDRAGVVWQGNEFAIPSSQLGRKIYIFEDVVVHREDLEKWVNGAMPDSQGGPQEAAEAPLPDDETPGAPETRKEKRARETTEKYKRWNDLAQEIKKGGKWTRPTEIASAIAKREKGSGERGVNAANIRRRLDDDYPGWAERGQAQKTGAK